MVKMFGFGCVICLVVGLVIFTEISGMRDPNCHLQRRKRQTGFPCTDPRCCADIDVPVWSPWSAYSSCSKSCGSGTQSRSRHCTGGVSCPGWSVKTRSCNTFPCDYGDDRHRD